MEDEFDTAPDSERPAEVDALALAVERHPMSVSALADALGMPDDRRFRISLWQAMEAYRERTGVHLRIDDGEVKACSPEQQVREADKRFRTAAARIARATRMLEPVLSCADHALRRRAERKLDAHTTRLAALDSTRAEEERQARIEASLGAALTRRVDQ